MCVLQAMAAENTSASLQLSGLEEQLGLMSLDLGALLQLVKQRLENTTLVLKPDAEPSLCVFPKLGGKYVW